MLRSLSGSCLLVCLGSVGMLALGAGADAPKASPAEQPDKKAAKADEGPPPDAELRVLEVSTEHESKLRKVNGVTLDLRAKVDRKFEGDVIVLVWELSYDGPRSPLIIVEPTIEKKTDATTRVTVYAVPEGKKVGWACELWSPVRERKPRSGLDLSAENDFDLPKEMFLRLGFDKLAKGEIRIPAPQLRKQLADRGADKFFDPKNPPRFFVKVRHEPKDRGEKHSLDAWTGRLWSDTVEVPQVKNW